jgi:hypothetical protein
MDIQNKYFFLVEKYSIAIIASGNRGHGAIIKTQVKNNEKKNVGIYVLSFHA